MSRRPIYMKSKSNSYLMIIALLSALILVMYGYNKNFSLQSLVENSELNGRTFSGKLEEIITPKSKIKAYFMQQNEVPIVAISFIFANTGSAYDEEDKKGIASLMASTITDATVYKSADAIRDEVGIKGISISFGSSKDNISGSLVAPKEYFEDAVTLLRDILTKPKFEKKYF